MTYSEKLKSPQWQIKRLEILNRDNFKCCHCDDNEKSLHVHHKTYVWGNDPWEYHDSNFITLCENCHQDEENAKVDFNDLVHDLLMMNYSYRDLHIALHYLRINASEQKGQNNG